MSRQSESAGFITDIHVGVGTGRMEDQVIEIHHDESHTDMPRQVDFQKVIQKVMQGLRRSTGRRKLQQQYCRNESIDQKMSRCLSLPENKAIISDCFWFILCKFFRKQEQPESEDLFQKRMAENYISLMLSIEDKNDNKLFFQDYFDILSQAVYHSLCLAYPQETGRLDNAFRIELVALLSKMFSGIDASKPLAYIRKWGVSKIGASIPQQTAESSLMSKSLPPVKRPHNIQRRQQVQLRYSPIVQLYLKTNKYKTRNFIPQFKMRYSKLSNDRYQDQLRLKKYQQQSNRILIQSQKQKKQDQQKKKKLEEQIRQIKRQTINHHKRLDKRKAEQMERGTHQYANYLVSMLNAGITLTSLGVIRKNDSL